MITLISKWKLRNGCPEELLAALKQLGEYTMTESGALMYLVNRQAPNPLDREGKPLVP